jgi:hypothetical protein
MYFIRLVFEVREMKRVCIIFAVIVCIVILSLSATAETATMTAQVDNNVPEASSVFVNELSDITLTANATTTVVGRATLSDNNGCEDITGATATLYRSTIGSEADDDNENHYSASCVMNDDCETEESDLTITCNCTFEMYWYADPTDAGSLYEAESWVFEVTPSDNAGPGTSDIGQQDVNSLLAMSLETLSIEFGSLSLGADTGSTNANTSVANYGNTKFDVYLSGYGSIPSDGMCMVCDEGSILVGNLMYDSQPFSYSEGSALDSSPMLLDLNVEAGSEADSSPSGLIYYGLGMPSDGVAGECTGTLVLTAEADSEI